LRTLNVPDVLIQVERSAVDLQKLSTTSGTIMLHEEIQQQSPEDLGDLTAKFSGVFMRSYGGAGGLKTLNARGLGSQHFLVVANSQSLLFNQMGSANLGDIQADGLASVAYSVGGSDSWELPTLAKTYSGVLHLKYMELNQSLKDFAQIQGIGASFGRYKLAGNWLKNTKRATYFAQAYGYQMQGDFPFEYQHGLVNVSGQRWYNHTRESAFRLEDNYQINAYNKLQGSATFLSAFRELPGAIVFYHPEHFQTLGNQQTNLNLRHEFNKDFLKILHYASLSQTLTDYRDSFHIHMPQWQHYKEHNCDVGHNGTLNFKDYNINWSGQYVFSNLQSNRADILLPRRHRGILNIGADYWHEGLKIRADMPIQFVSDQLWQYENQNRVLFTPSLGVNKMWSKPRYSTVIRASAGQFARLATFSEMYYGQIGNPNLRPEVSQMLNFGFHHSRKTDHWQMHLGTDFFGGLVRDKIIAIPTQNLFIWSVRNIQTVRSYGFDAMASLEKKWRAHSGLKLTQKSSLNVAQDISHPDSPTYGHQIPYTPYWLHNSEISWAYKKLIVSYGYSFNDFRFVLGENIAANVLDAFHLHDLRFNYALKTHAESKHEFRIHFKANNLFNAQYQVMRGFPMPGRNFEFGLAWRM